MSLLRGEGGKVGIRNNHAYLSLLTCVHETSLQYFLNFTNLVDLVNR